MVSYYDKYTLLNTLSISPVYTETTGLSMGGSDATLWSSYTFNANTGVISGAGTKYSYPLVAKNLNADIYFITGGSWATIYNKYYGGSAYGLANDWRFKTKNMSVSKVKGPYIATISATEGAYPEDGPHTDGYYYVKKINKYLVQEGIDIKIYDGSAWSTIGTAPVTKEMFDTNGINDISTIPEGAWKSTMKILRWAETEEARNIIVTLPASLYDNTIKEYKGIGIIETEVETLSESRSTLIVTADHKEAIFHYSLDDGANWKVLSLEETIDIKNAEGHLLKIKVELPTITATLSALSYAWA